MTENVVCKMAAILPRPQCVYNLYPEHQLDYAYDKGGKIEPQSAISHFKCHFFIK